MIKVSIVVPVYKVEKYIIRCLHSVVSQTYHNIECIIVNDSTPDRSFDIAQAFVKDHSDIDFRFAQHDKNKGLSEARNTGVRIATGDYVYFLDSDDAISPSAIEDLVAVAEANNKPDIVYGHTIAIDDDGKRHPFEPDTLLPSMTDNRDILLGNLYNLWPRIACNKLVLRTVFTDLGKWFCPGLLHEDELWTFEVATAINTMIFCPKVTYIYYVGDKDSITRSAPSERDFRDNISILERKLTYIQSSSCPHEVAENVYNLSYLFYYSIVQLHFRKSFRKECRLRLHRIINSANSSGNWRLRTKWHAKLVWFAIR